MSNSGTGSFVIILMIVQSHNRAHTWLALQQREICDTSNTHTGRRERGEGSRDGWRERGERKREGGESECSYAAAGCCYTYILDETGGTVHNSILVQTTKP